MNIVINQKPWYLYLIRTERGDLYTGITIDLSQRLHAHQQGHGAKYLRGKGNLTYVYHTQIHERTLAAKLEYRIKKLSKRQKEQLVQQQPSAEQLIAALLISTSNN